MGKRIIVTGGSGKVGRHVIVYLLDQGHAILNLDVQPLTGDLAEKVYTLKVDLTDTGQVYCALTSHFKLTEPFSEGVPLNQPPDAIIHLAGYARNMLVPDVETFRGNTVSTYNVLEASCRLGLTKIIIASSVCVYGVTFAEMDVDFPSFPIDEDVDTDPMDVYSISKVCAERTARGFAKKFGVDIYALRIGAVIAPDEYEKSFSGYQRDPVRWKVHGWSYTDARDLGQLCDRCVAVNGLGFQVFNATNNDITNTSSSMEFLTKTCPKTPFTRELSATEAPMSNRKARELLGFKENHNWRNYYSAESHETSAN